MNNIIHSIILFMPRRGEHTKEELETLVINAATELLEEGGLEAISTRKIAAKIGYTHGTVHSFYKNFGDLILKINAITLERIYDKLEKVSMTSKSHEKALKGIAHAYVEYGLENNNRWQALYEFHYPKVTGENLPSWYEESIHRNFALVELHVSHFCAKPAQVRIYSQVLWSSLHGIAILSLSGKLDSVKAKSVKTLIDSFVELFIAGLKKVA